VALALFYRKTSDCDLEVWVQERTDDGPYQGLLEFPGGGIESYEDPLMAAVREVSEEVGITILAQDGKFMGIYTNELLNKTILLYVFLFPHYPALSGKGDWLKIQKNELSFPYLGKIPTPNHQIIDDLYRSLFS
jgi:8-oxo-dGTP pyrophosphatase MutT (NUDIX family)